MRIFLYAGMVLPCYLFCDYTYYVVNDTKKDHAIGFYDKKNALYECVICAGSKRRVKLAKQPVKLKFLKYYAQYIYDFKLEDNNYIHITSSLDPINNQIFMSLLQSHAQDFSTVDKQTTYPVDDFVI